jgi:hypothetical protein
MSAVQSDIAIVICSRGRERTLARLLADLQDHFLPAVESGGLRCCVWVYAQGYAAEALDRLRGGLARLEAAGQLVVVPAGRTHSRIGDVVQTALRAVNDGSRYKLAMLMDDDSVYYDDPVVGTNLERAARTFIDRGHRAYSIKLGTGYDLGYGPFVNCDDPIMPFKEKMLWVSRAVAEEVVALPGFADLSIGEDAVIAAVAWLPAPEACRSVHGIATFLHLSYEASAEFGSGDVAGGYADLMNYTGPPPDATHFGKYEEALRRGVTPQHVMPDVFVPEGHRHWEFNGIRREVIARMQGAGCDAGRPDER